MSTPAAIGKGCCQPFSFREVRYEAAALSRNQAFPDCSVPSFPLSFFLLSLCIKAEGCQSLLSAHRYLQNTGLVWQEVFSLRVGCRRDQLPAYPDGNSWNKSIQVFTRSSTGSAFSHVGTSQHLIKSLTEVVKECVFCKLSYENVPRIAINSPKGNF